MAPVMPFADNATMVMLADEKEMYSRIRLGGTIGYGLAAPIAGVLVQNHGLSLAFWGSATLLLVGLVVSQKLVHGQLDADVLARGHVRALMSNPHWILFLIVALSGGSALAVFNMYLFPHMRELGASESTMGLALMVGMVSEIPALFFGNRLIKRLRGYRLLMLSMVVTGLRLLLFAASETPSLVLAIQLLNGLTFPTMSVAGVSYADERASAGMSATAQGLFSAVVLGFGTAVDGLIGGPLLERGGGRVLYFDFGVAVLVIVTVVALIHRRLPEEKISPNGVTD